MSEDQSNEDEDQEDSYELLEIDLENPTKPPCKSCGDPVKIVYQESTPFYAQHCRECYAEVRYGKVPRASRRRRSL